MNLGTGGARPFQHCWKGRFRVPYGWYTDRRGVSWRITS